MNSDQILTQAIRCCDVGNTITKAPQTIAFADLPPKVIGDLPFVVTATATSGLDVTFTVEGDCSIPGSAITLLKAGNCTVTAQQASNANYNPAPTSFARL